MGQRERISQTGHAFILCPFHKERTPSLRVWPNGGFFCHGCHYGGWIKHHPQLAARYRVLRDNHPALRNGEQLCFPWRGVEVFDMEDQAPKPTGRYRDVSLTGCLIPWKGGQPVFMSMPGSPLSYLATFTTEAKLRAVMVEIGIEIDSIKNIDDGTEFLSSIPLDVPVIIDPHRVGDKTRWTEVKRGQPS